MLEAFTLVYYLNNEMIPIRDYESIDACVHEIEMADDNREYDCILILPDNEQPMDY